MTVKCLNPDQQNSICVEYTEQHFSINDLALNYGRSRRTIVRVLESHGVYKGRAPKLTASMLPCAPGGPEVRHGILRAAAADLQTRLALVDAMDTHGLASNMPLGEQVVAHYGSGPKVEGSALFRAYEFPSTTQVTKKPWYSRFWDQIVKLMADGSPINLP